MAFRLSIGGIVLALLGWWVSTLFESETQRAPAYVEPLPASARSPRAVPAMEGLLGVIISSEAVELAPRFDGKLDGVRVQVGDRVRQGQVVAVLDTQVEQRELAIAQAELLSARSEQEVAALSLEQAQERLQRRQDSEQLALGALSQEELATAQYEQRVALAKLGAARSQVQQREARVAQYQHRIAEATLRAPFDGVVASRYVDAGALLRQGQAVVHLLRGGTPRVRFAIPEQQLQASEVGQPVRIEVPNRGMVLMGRVAHVAPEVDSAARMIFAIADVEEVPGDPSLLPSGLAVRVFPGAPLAQAGSQRMSPGQE